MRRRTLGICLGAQLIAAARGERVYPSPGGVEIGFGPLDLTAAGAAAPLGEVAGTPVLHWHGDTFDLPGDAELLASTPACANQAFAIDDHVLALQFHVEADPARIEQWLIGHSHELVSGGHDIAKIRDDAARYGGEEFAVILPATDAVAAREVAERIRRQVEGLAIPHSGNPGGGCVTISMGLSTRTPPQTADFVSLMQSADKALYRAKESGRNAVSS